MEDAIDSKYCLNIILNLGFELLISAMDFILET